MNKLVMTKDELARVSSNEKATIKDAQSYKLILASMEKEIANRNALNAELKLRLTSHRLVSVESAKVEPQTPRMGR